MKAQFIGVTDTVMQNEKILINFNNQTTFYEKETNNKELVFFNQKKKIIQNLETVVKRIVDIIVGIIGLIILIPLTIFIYAINMVCGDQGPIFYIQDRIGKDGKIFKMIKYRTMVIGAEKKLKQYLEENKEAREEYKKYKKLKNDPRITKVGKFLRKTSLDEMPQFINILKGDMSLIGPRPYLVTEKDEMEKYYDVIIKCTPGLSGLWQTEGRSNLTFTDRLDLDIRYYKDWSLKLDFKILIKTFQKVLGKDGAI